MRLNAAQLTKQLKNSLLPVYLVSSDDPLLQQETCDAIRQHCRAQGYSERHVFHAERGFNWNQLREVSASLSLFADKRLLELRIPSGKPGDQGSAFLQAYLERPADDSVLLITVPRLDGSTLRTKWAKALHDSAACGFVQIPVITPEQLPQWLQQRLQGVGLSADAEVLELICDRVEGNLLAAAQEIEKLRLLTDATHLDLETVQQVIADSARYDLFSFVDATLAGDHSRSLRMLHGLRAEGNDIPILLWALARDLRQLSSMGHHFAQGQSLQQITSKVWPAARKPLLQNAVQRHPAQHWQNLLRSAQRIDEQSKGQAAGDPWLSLEQLLLQF